MTTTRTKPTVTVLFHFLPQLYRFFVSFPAVILLLLGPSFQPQSSHFFVESSSSSSSVLNHIQVKLLGKTYDIEKVSNVGQVQLKLQQESGVTPQQQGRALFGGKQLSPLDELTCQEVGVCEGDTITFVPKKKQKQQQNTNTWGESTMSSMSSGSTTMYEKENTLYPNTNNDQHQQQQYPQQQNANPNNIPPTTLEQQKEELLQEIRKSSILLMMIKNGSLTLDDAAVRYAEIMPKIVHHPLFTTIMLDEERLERNRTLILQSPMYPNMISRHPKLEFTLNDPILYRESIRNGIKMLQGVSNEQLVSMFMEYVKQMLQY